MKYYINYESQHYLVDSINTPYLTARGYVEVTKAEYEAYVAERLAEFEEELK